MLFITEPHPVREKIIHALSFCSLSCFSFMNSKNQQRTKRKAYIDNICPRHIYAIRVFELV